jgi:uncharacterized protein
MTFVDSNIPMYLVGGDHPHKIDAQRMLERLVAAGERLVTSAEILQEILHRYVAIDRREAIQPAMDVLLEVADEVFPIEQSDVQRAKAVLDGVPSLSARDALHVAVMRRREVTRLLSFDAGFDLVPGIERLAP